MIFNLTQLLYLAGKRTYFWNRDIVYATRTLGDFIFRLNLSFKL